VSALGGLLGSWAAGRLRSQIGYGWSILAALMLGAVAFVVVSATTNVVVVGVALAGYICHAVVWNVLSSSVRQKIVPAEFMGRVGSFSRLLGLIGLAAIGGWLASTFGLRVPFAVSVALFVIASLLCVVTMRQLRIWEARQMMDAPAARSGS
jgi:MFS family permease